MSGGLILLLYVVNLSVFSVGQRDVSAGRLGLHTRSHTAERTGRAAISIVYPPKYLHIILLNTITLAVNTQLLQPSTDPKYYGSLSVCVCVAGEECVYLGFGRQA